MDLTGADRARRLAREPRVQDAALVAVLLVIAALELLYPAENYRRGGPLINVFITLAIILPLGARRRAPTIVLAVSSAALGLPTLVTAHDLLFWSSQLPLAIAYYTVARYRPLRVALPAVVLPAAAFTVYALYNPSVADGFALETFFLLFFGIALAAGVALRRDAAVRAALVEALSRLTLQQQQREQLVVLDERARLARELQVTVERALIVMLRDAARARAALPTARASARESVLSLEAAGRDATADLRRMLGLLRADHELEPADQRIAAAEP